MVDYNSDGFHQKNDTYSTVYADLNASTTAPSYDTWDWKQLATAILGVYPYFDMDLSRSVSDPNSLQQAAYALLNAMNTLDGVSVFLENQADALAGDNGPWKGDGADAFHDSMINFSRKVKAFSDTIRGGTDTTRGRHYEHSLPQQLSNNAIALSNSMTLAYNLTDYYTQLAIKLGNGPSSNGAVTISNAPKVVDLLASSLRTVIKNLDQGYVVTRDAIVPPPPVTSPVDGGDGPGGIGGGDELGGGPGGGIPDVGDLGGAPSLGDFGGGVDPQNLAALAGPGLDPGGGGLDLSGGDAPSLGDLGSGGGIDLPSLDDPSGLDLGGTGGDVPGLDPSDFGNSFTPADYPVLPGLGGLSGRPGTSGDDVFDGVSTADPGTFGDTGLDDGLGNGLGNGLADGLGDGLGTDAGLPSQLATSSGMPYMPGMGGAGAGGAGLSTEPTDASGLLDPSTEPWEGDTTMGDEVGSELGAEAGGEGLGLGGMPYMPGMGAPGGGRDAASERSDASGLLDPSTEPWQGEASTDGDEVDSPEGTLPGVPYLLGFGADTAAPAAAGRSARQDGEPSEVSDPESAAPEQDSGVEPSASGAPVMVGSDGMPVGAPDNDGSAPRPMSSDGESGDEEDFSAWDAAVGASAFVPLLWALPEERRTRSAADESEQGESSEPWNTWQPERPSSEEAPGPSTVWLASGDDTEPEAEESDEESDEEMPEQAERSIADLLVQEESTWGTVPGGPGTVL